MSPIEFVVFDGDSSPNTPTIYIAEAMKNNIKILGAEGEYEVLSYYYNHKECRMVIDIGRVSENGIS